MSTADEAVERISTHQQCKLFGCDLIDLLRREGRYSGVWFGYELLLAADHLERLALRTSSERTEKLEAALEVISSQAICYGMRADENELRDWLKFISETADATLSEKAEQ